VSQVGLLSGRIEEAQQELRDADWLFGVVALDGRGDRRLAAPLDRVDRVDRVSEPGSGCRSAPATGSGRS